MQRVPLDLKARAAVGTLGDRLGWNLDGAPAAAIQLEDLPPHRCVNIGGPFVFLAYYCKGASTAPSRPLLG
ncbi:MAG TPA: hypothetical protein VNY05_20370 [Candidatus Acidoferrales bacterium]|nr:hypothetical protein [Candidatus Acidoferrales bacterium]